MSFPSLPFTRLAKAIFLSDTRAVIDERNAREAAQLEELFNGPALGRTVTTSSSDSPEGENSCEDESVTGRASEQKGEKREGALSTAAKEERSFAKITQVLDTVCFYFNRLINVAILAMAISLSLTCCVLRRFNSDLFIVSNMLLIRWEDTSQPSEK
jgi:hypothetical protein